VHRGQFSEEGFFRYKKWRETAVMPKKSHHVVPDPDGGWNVKKGGATRASKHFETRDEAVSWGRDVSRNQGSELVIHKRDGTIYRKDSHGNDPYPPRDRK
jgi:hypothetical protein